MRIGYVQAKGGQGCTTLAAIVALTCAQQGRTVLIGQPDIWGYLGTLPPPDGIDDYSVPGLTVLTGDSRTGPGPGGGFDHVISDGRLFLPGAVNHLVTRACYPALVAATRIEFDGIVLIEEPDRALTADDVGRCLGKPIVARLQWDPAIARAVDAGLLPSRVPKIGKILTGER